MTLAKAGDRPGTARGMGDRCQQPCTPPVALVNPHPRSLQTYQELEAQGAPSKLPCSNPTSPEHRVIFRTLPSTKKTCASRSRRASGTSTRQNSVAPTTLLHPDMGATTHSTTHGGNSQGVPALLTCHPQDSLTHQYPPAQPHPQRAAAPAPPPGGALKTRAECQRAPAGAAGFWGFA